MISARPGGPDGVFVGTSSAGCRPGRKFPREAPDFRGFCCRSCAQAVLMLSCNDGPMEPRPLAKAPGGASPARLRAGSSLAGSDVPVVGVQWSQFCTAQPAPTTIRATHATVCPAASRSARLRPGPVARSCGPRRGADRRTRAKGRGASCDHHRNGADRLVREGRPGPTAHRGRSRRSRWTSRRPCGRRTRRRCPGDRPARPRGWVEAGRCRVHGHRRGGASTVRNVRRAS